MAEADAHEGWEQRVRRMPWFTVPGILLGVPVFLGLLVQLDRRLFWDRFVWKYYWGPIVADAEGRSVLCNAGTGRLIEQKSFLFWTWDVWGCTDPAGIAARSGYNVVNTLTWAVLLGVCLLGLTQLLVAMRQPMTARMVYGATAWVVVGSVWHVIEDTDLMEPPLQYFFITPPIYLFFGALGVASFVFGAWLSNIEARAGTTQAMRQSWLVLMALVLGYTLLWRQQWSQVGHWVNPLWAATGAAAAQLALWWMVRRRGRLEGSSVLLAYPIGWLVVALAYVTAFQRDPWSAVNEAAATPSALWLAPGLAGLITLAVWAVGRRAAAAGRVWGPAFTQPVNLLIVFAQVLDGVATSLGLDLAGYQEKHVLSERIISGFEAFAHRIGWEFGATYKTFLSFLPLKLGLSLLVVYVMDVSAREDTRSNPTLMGLVKFAIIMVGIGPGIRDFVRLAMGV